MNYLIPIGAQLDSEPEVKYEAVDAGRVLDAMAVAGNRFNIVILDACRANPFARSWRAPQRGLAPVQAAAGMFIAYATAPGSVAADGEGRNGLYTQQLLQQMRVPNQPVECTFKRVRAAVMSATDGKQIPWETSSLIGDFYFNPAPQQPSQAPPVTLSTPQTGQPARSEVETGAPAKLSEPTAKAALPRQQQQAEAFLASSLQGYDVAVTETSLAFTVNECVELGAGGMSEDYCLNVRQTIDLRGLQVQKATTSHWFTSAAAVLVASAHPVRRDMLNLRDYPGVPEPLVLLKLRGSNAGRRKAWLYLKGGVSLDRTVKALQALAR